MDIPYENNAAWDASLGFGLTYPNYNKIPCRVAI